MRIVWLCSIIVCAAGSPVEPEPDPGRELLVTLLQEIDELNRELDTLRQALAEARLDAAATRRELQLLVQFITDHDEYGSDFEQYTAIKTIAESDARRRRITDGRHRRETLQAEQAARMKAARAERTGRQRELDRINEYRRSGFTPLGFDVFLGQTAFYYQSSDGLGARIKWDPGLGNYLRVYPYSQIDFSAMTISGSVLNASQDVRNIGVAVTFFDENGNQVGAEIVQINNARPDVPYPFTATLSMALNRAFDSSSTYVLYADLVEPPLVPSP